MKAMRKRLLGAGILVLILTNAVALTGVAYNRISPPDSVLTLTERELYPQWSWMWREGENSGSSVRLQFRTESVPNPRLEETAGWDAFSAYGGFGSVRWLDKDKLAALGFDVDTLSAAAKSGRHYERLSEREVLLVLELDGPAYARVLQDARDRVTHLEQRAAAEPEDKQTAQRLRRARDDLEGQEHHASRLFVVDAGLDQATLRQRYPDGTQYAIVRGSVSPFAIPDPTIPDLTSTTLYGRVTAVRCDSIQVPLQFQGAVHVIGGTHVGPRTLPRSIIQVAFGRRLEPWIVSAHAGTP